MAVTQNDIQPGVFETISNEFIGTFNLNEWTSFKLDGYFPFVLSDIVIKEGATVIPASNYEIATDTKATTQESGLSGKTLYGAIRITNVAYTGVELNVSGSNFGTYGSTQGVKDYIEGLLLNKTEPEGSNIDEGEIAVFVGGGSNIESDNSGAITQWDAGTIYNVAGTLVRREGITYSATGQATNQAIDPSDPDNALYWYEPDDARTLKRWANRGKVIDGDFHTINDRSGVNYAQHLRIEKTKVGGVNKEFHMIHLDGSVVTGNTTLENLLSGNPYIDLIAPDNLGTRTLVDMSSRHVAPMSSGGENDVLGEVLSSRNKSHQHAVRIGVYTASANYADHDGIVNTALGQFGTRDGYLQGDASQGFDTGGDNSTGGPTSRSNELTVGASYVIVMVDA